MNKDVTDTKFDNPTVLIVDDERINFMILREMLTPHNINVVYADDGDKAVEYARQNSCHLVLMDVMMPRMDGVTATGLLRQIWPKVPVVAVTAVDYMSKTGRQIESLFDAYLNKPVDHKTLVQTISRFLTPVCSSTN